ncbi:hypothetical protein Tco_1106391 [Tanacetum coccineum]
MDEHGVIKQWYCYCDNERRDIKGEDIIFSDYLIIRHTNIDKSWKNVMLNEGVLDSFEIGSNSSSIHNDPYSKTLQRYSSELKNEVTQLANEYERRIGKKGPILDDIWGKCKKVYGGTIESWYDEGFEEEEQRESDMDGTIMILLS